MTEPKINEAADPISENTLAVTIAKAIFACGDEPGSPCKRIQFKGGIWPDRERDQGGIGEAPLAALIDAQLKAQTRKRREDKL